MEEELRNALRRKAAPPDFAKRVIERVSGGPAPRLSVARAPVLHRWRALAAAVMLVAILGGWTAHTIAERRAGERAKDEVLLALRIAGEKVHYAKSQVHEIGRK